MEIMETIKHVVLALSIGYFGVGLTYAGLRMLEFVCCSLNLSDFAMKLASIPALALMIIGIGIVFLMICMIFYVVTGKRPPWFDR